MKVSFADIKNAKNKKEILFSDIEGAVLSYQVDAGLLIHENRFTYEEKGLEKIIDLGYCRDFYSKNNTIYALCNEGLFKSTDWTYWVEEKEIIPNDWQRQIGRGSNAELRNNYNASGMFIDDKFEIYFGYGYSSQFGQRVKFKT